MTTATEKKAKKADPVTPGNLPTVKMSVRITFEEDLLGSWPADPAVLTRFISSKAPDAILETEEGDTIPERNRESGLTVFPEDGEGVFLYNYMLKGFLKESGNILKDALKIKNLKHKIGNLVFVGPRRLAIYRDGGRIIECDDVLERPLRAETRMGPRVTLVGSERIAAPAYIDAAIELIPNKDVDMDVIRQLLEYGKFKGLGQWRSASFGVFSWQEI